MLIPKKLFSKNCAYKNQKPSTIDYKRKKPIYFLLILEIV
ncbi:Uncharacterized protein dnm_023860 [Desulfonema magnum]|uniref:Uncharacterized protein n=1 Tax=Desulfonema magnum TaxID=45655 RepID=A0A975BJ86_9BACT|nr:Uncharacterized protein dnm_023860 [Desulfonema magnum]